MLAVSWYGCRLLMGAVSIVCYLLRRSRHTPAPAGGGGQGGRGRTDNRPKAAQGEGAAKAGAGGARPGGRRRGPPDRAAPERSHPAPQGRDRAAQAAPPEPNKTEVLLGSSGGCRRRTLAAVRSAPNSRKKFRKTGDGVRQHGGVLRHPPIGALCFVLASHVTAVTCDQFYVDFVCLAWYYL